MKERHEQTGRGGRQEQRSETHGIFRKQGEARLVRMPCGQNRTEEGGHYLVLWGRVTNGPITLEHGAWKKSIKRRSCRFR